jgi:hypothetical protein
VPLLPFLSIGRCHWCSSATAAFARARTMRFVINRVRVFSED